MTFKGYDVNEVNLTEREWIMGECGSVAFIDKIVCEPCVMALNTYSIAPDEAKDLVGESQKHGARLPSHQCFGRDGLQCDCGCNRRRSKNR